MVGGEGKMKMDDLSVHKGRSIYSMWNERFGKH